MMKNFDFFGAPVGIIVTCDRCIDVNGWGPVGAFLQSACLLAEERGMGTCLQEAFATYHEVVYKELNIPREQILWCGISLLLSRHGTSCKYDAVRESCRRFCCVWISKQNMR